MILRQVKSFVLRAGKITPGQQRAIDNIFAFHSVGYVSHLVDLNIIFGRDNPKIIEIGFGMGKSTSQIALANPEYDYLGIEVHPPGIGSLLMEIEQYDICNIKVIRYDGVKVIKDMIKDNSIYGFHIFFPDPWHKKRHNKRRIIQPAFIDMLCNKLKPGGYIHLATDWEDYAIWMLDILNSNKQLINTSETNDYVPRPLQRPETKFEQRGISLGHSVWDLIFKKNI
ncbi:MAG: tRNA ((46)-N7)-methyltransferase TrmB [Burkholderiales bacterium]|jgi:tRNA (guanine-N7-)-methyltransferase|nr:tRNA ((46)-N7)-methyltransferase TrmB [Burkholderiales bacterium]